MRALLLGTQIDEAVQAREEHLLANANHLLDSGDPDAREPHGDLRRARLNIITRGCCRGRLDGVHRRGHLAGKISARLATYRLPAPTTPISGMTQPIAQIVARCHRSGSTEMWEQKDCQ